MNFDEYSGLGAEIAMASLDKISVEQDTLTLLDHQLRGERLSVETNEEGWPLGRIIFIVLVSILVLWIGIHFAVRAIF
jgi:hypothetical protein